MLMSSILNPSYIQESIQVHHQATGRFLTDLNKMSIFYRPLSSYVPTLYRNRKVISYARSYKSFQTLKILYLCNYLNVNRYLNSLDSNHTVWSS